MSIKTVMVGSQLEDLGLISYNKTINPVGSTIKRSTANLTTFMQEIDAMQACSRFKWVGLPKGISSARIEQMLYARGSLVFFQTGGQFFILPYSQSGGINIYGLPCKVTPLAYNGEQKQTKFSDELTINYSEEYDETANAIILYDRVSAMYGLCGGKQVLQQTIIKEITERFSSLNVNLKTSQGKNILICKDEKAKEAVEKQLNELYYTNEAWAILRSMFEVQIINNDITYKEQEIWEDITSWNNLRLESLGISNNGLFNKKERQLTGEISTISDATTIILDNYLNSRKLFVKMVKNQFKDYAEQLKDLDCILISEDKEINTFENQESKKEETQNITNDKEVENE